MDLNVLKNEKISYLFFGVLTTFINISIFYTLSFFPIPLFFVNTVAWFLSVLFAYFTNKKYVFKSSKDSDIIPFFLSRFSTLFLETIILLEFSNVIPNTLLKISTQFLIIVLNYIVSKFLVFKKD